MCPGDHNTSRKRNDSTLNLITSPQRDCGLWHSRLRQRASAPTLGILDSDRSCAHPETPGYSLKLYRAVCTVGVGRGLRLHHSLPQIMRIRTVGCGERKVYQGAHSSLTFIFLLAIACLGTHGCFSSEESALGRNDRNEVSNAVAYYYNSRPHAAARKCCVRPRRRAPAALCYVAPFLLQLASARRSAQVPAL